RLFLRPAPTGSVVARAGAARSRVEPRNDVAAVARGRPEILELDVFGGQFFDKPRRQRGLPEPAHAPVGGVIDFRLPSRPRQPDISETPLFLEAGSAVFVE